MKTKITALALVAVTALALAPKPAQAGNNEWAVVGGVIGGLIIGSALNEASHHDYPTRHTTVIVNDRHDGYWNEVRVKVWVPGCWVVDRHHGRTVKRYVSGRYEYRTDRVWVATNRYDRYDRRDDRRDDRHDRRDDRRDDRRSDYGRGR